MNGSLEDLSLYRAGENGSYMPNLQKFRDNYEILCIKTCIRIMLLFERQKTNHAAASSESKAGGVKFGNNIQQKSVEISKK